MKELFRERDCAKDEPVDAFDAAWVEDLIQRPVEALAAECCAQGKGDYIRVLYGRLCTRLTIAQIAERLEISPANVDHYYRAARKKLAEILESVVREQVARYYPAGEAEQAVAAEWQQVGRHRASRGGLEEAVQRAYDVLDPVQAKDRSSSISAWSARSATRPD